MPSHCYRMRVFDRDLIRGGHYGQRSCEPHLKAEHSCTDQCCKREESPCQLGAVHTWHMALICRFQRVPPTEESSRCCSCIRQREGRPTCWKPGSKSPNFHFSLRACSQQFLRLPEIFPSEPRPAPFVEAWLARAGSRPCAPSLQAFFCEPPIFFRPCHTGRPFPHCKRGDAISVPIKTGDS